MSANAATDAADGVSEFGDKSTTVTNPIVHRRPSCTKPVDYVFIATTDPRGTSLTLNSWVRQSILMERALEDAELGDTDQLCGGVE
jgi:hypothetical protein